MKRSQLQYSLPEELIAQHPAERRDDSRLLVYERQTGEEAERFSGETGRAQASWDDGERLHARRLGARPAAKLTPRNLPA